MEKSTIKSIIVDDESHCRQALQQQLEWSCPRVEVVASASHVNEAIKSIEEYQPDLVFLDIEMPEKNGFDLIREIKQVNFEIIFTTAYDEFALEAFRVDALDYLLKPIDEEQLIKAVDKASFLIKPHVTMDHIQSLINEVKNQKQIKTIALPTSEGVEFVSSDDIIHCQADGSYSHIQLTDGRTLVLAKSLFTIEALIGLPHFIRSHQSHLINLNFIQRFLHSDGGIIILKNGQQIPLSRSKKKAWKAWVSGL